MRPPEAEERMLVTRRRARIRVLRVAAFDSTPAHAVPSERRRAKLVTAEEAGRAHRALCFRNPVRARHALRLHERRRPVIARFVCRRTDGRLGKCSNPSHGQPLVALVEQNATCCIAAVPHDTKWQRSRSGLRPLNS
jgi:hypothetical protein